MRSLISFMMGRRKEAGRRTRAHVSHGRFAYRIQRLSLTPIFKISVRFGLPLLFISVIAAFFLASAERRAVVVVQYEALREAVWERPELQVNLVSVEGASSELSDAVRSALDLSLPISSFELDLEALRKKVLEFDAIEGADLLIRSGGVLQIRIIERAPVVIWRKVDGSLELLDGYGYSVAGLKSRLDRPDLPLIAGEGADSALLEALDVFKAAAPLSSRIRGLVRVGERRWDLVLDHGQRVLLPSSNVVSAVERLIALEQIHRVMERSIVIADLRIERRPVLRLTPKARVFMVARTQEGNSE